MRSNPGRRLPRCPYHSMRRCPQTCDLTGCRIGVPTPRLQGRIRQLLELKPAGRADAFPSRVQRRYLRWKRRGCWDGRGGWRSVGESAGAPVGIGMLDADTGPATGALVGGIGVGTGSCPQARVRARTMDMMAKVDFMGEPYSNPIQCASIVAITWEGRLTSSQCRLTFSK